MNAIAIIPARLAASRFPNKPMAKIHGMPMIGHCFHRSRLAAGIQATYVATCDEEIAAYIRGIGGEAIMTSNTHRRAATRTAEALEHVERSTGRRPDVVVMVQGDEPMILPTTIGETLKHFTNNAIGIVNIMARIRTEEQFRDRNNVKVVVNQQSEAMYFSREPIPSPWKGTDGVPMFLQTGIIAFRRDVLLEFNRMAETRLEQIESVDMNRVLENGGRIRMVPSEAVSFGVDTPAELGVAEEIIAKDPTLRAYLPS